MTIENGEKGSVSVLDLDMAGVDGKSAPHGVAGAPNEAALLALMERTGYSMIQENGQRKYGGPPPNWEGPPPPRGCEIFVGKIPRDCYEDELVPIFEKLGAIYELRLMMDFSGANRGYCFVQFTDRQAAKRAMKELNNHEIRKGRFLGVCLSVDNCRLFVGGIPKNKQREEIMTEMSKVTEGVTDVIVYPSANDKAKNRGFAFVEYESHRAAAMARRKLIPGRIQLWGHQIAVDWAEPEQEVDEDVMSKVRILYVRNLMMTTTEEHIEQVFNASVTKENAVERVKKLRDYAFVHFREREDALTALDRMNGTNLDGSYIEVVLAKPVDKSEYVRFTRSNAGVPGRPGFPQDPLQSYSALAGLPTDAAYPATPYYPPQLGVSPMPGSALSLRDLQNRSHLGAMSMRGTYSRGRGRGAAGSRGAGGIGRGSYVPSYLRSPYRKYPTDERLYDLLPGMELTPTNPITLKPQSAKQPVQVLEEFCQKSGWGSPTYQLHSTLTRDGGNSADIQLFLFKVSIPALAGHYPNNSFQPNKLCRSVEEAKNFAAEYVLLQLGVPMEGGDGNVAAVAAAAAASSPTTPLVTSTVAPPVAATSPVTYAARGLPPPTAYSLTNGAPCITHSDLTYATSVPIVSTTAASYMVAPAKVPTPVTLNQPSLQSFPHAAFTPLAAAGYQQY